MSYPPPYQPPQPDYSNFHHPDALAPARRAATLLYIMGALSLLGTLCCGVGTVLLPQLLQQPDFASGFQQIPGATEQTMRIAMIALAAGSFIIALLFAVLAVFVGRGSKAAAIVGIVLAALSLLYLGGTTISTLVMARNGPPQQLLGVCFLVVPVALLILLIVWLVGAIKASDQVASQRYAMQYWQYAQQQAYQGYGQAPPPMPPMPPAPPQPPAPPPPSSGDANGPSSQG